MTGYEKSPDYGGPEPTWGSIIGGVVLMIAVSAIIAMLVI